MRFTAGPNLQRDKTRRKRGGLRQTDREVGGPGRSLKTMYVFASFQADCYAVPIPDIPEAAWLASGSEWLILEQRVLHSSNHLSQPQARQSTTSTTRHSFVPVNLHPEKVLWNFIHIRKGTHFFHPLLQGPSSFPLTRHIRHPSQPHDVAQLIPEPHCPVGLGREEAREATRTPLGDRCLSGKTPPLVLLPSQLTTHTL